MSEIYELRLVMEPFFAERAALLATPVQRTLLGEAGEQLAAIPARADLAAWLDDDANYRQLFQLDMQFHVGPKRGHSAFSSEGVSPA